MNTTANNTAPPLELGSTSSDGRSSVSEFGFVGRTYFVSVVGAGLVDVSERMRTGPFHIATLTIDKEGVIADAEWGVPFSAQRYTEWRATMLTLVRSHGVRTLQEASVHE